MKSFQSIKVVTLFLSVDDIIPYVENKKDTIRKKEKKKKKKNLRANKWMQPSCKLQFSSVHLLSRFWLLATPWTATHQASLSTDNSWSLLKLMSIESVIPSNHLILCHPLLLLPWEPYKQYEKANYKINIKINCLGLLNTFCLKMK